ncbi:hypothetical protein CI109_106268 [Kwoniella shandongensis]|uniref:Uncharacterized protein n=1 Tax=Kwoniella shandongensis TaxID=1734106 RepID=A0A5M6C3Y8_9TREE|nr:uncharacterized protein CI109_003871 [Kwoniella shandongensis]KAA5527899.1 hypothetical protein CI109_003871 [Kwoniella shandongensis]
MSSSCLPPFLQTSPPPTAPPSQARLQALYASTSTQRGTNPTGYAANSQWWSSVLEETLRSGWLNGDSTEGGGDRLVLTVDETLLGRLEDSKGVRPKGIGGVVETLSTTSPPTLHPLTHFFASPLPIHAPPSLTSRFIGRPLWWAVSQLNPFGSSSDKVEKEEVLWARYGKGKEYVHMPLLEQTSASFTAYMSTNPILSYTTSLFDLESFREEFGEACFPSSPSAKKLPAGKHRLSKKDVEVLIKWLERDCGLVVTDGKVIKILEPGQEDTDHPINEADRGAVSVMNALRKIELQISSIEEQIAQSHEKAKKHLSLNQKTIALSYLRSKKQLEDLLAKRVGSSEQLRAVIRSIDQAKGDVEIMAAYETSTSTLTQVLSHPSLSLDKIADTTDALAEAMADQEEIDQAVRLGGEVAMGSKRVEVDEEDLAAELEGLVEEEEAEKARETAKRVADEERQRQRVAAAASAAAAKEKEEAEKKSRTTTAGGQQKQNQVEEKSTKETEEEMWERRFEEAQARKKEELQRAEVERLKKEEKRVVAE